MKILGISGSPRDKTTNQMLKMFLDETGQDYQLIKLKDKNIKPCFACGECYKNNRCITKDDMQEIYNKLLKAEVIVLGSPTYFSNVSALMKTFIDRCLPFYRSKELKNKKVILISIGDFKGRKIPKKEMENSVKKCIEAMAIFSKEMEMKNIGNVFAINGNPEMAKDKLIKLAKKII